MRVTQANPLDKDAPFQPQLLLDEIGIAVHDYSPNGLGALTISVATSLRNDLIVD